jgi:hypothetical protein
MKSQVIQHLALHFQYLLDQEVISYLFSGSFHICNYFSQVHMTNTSAFVYVLLVMKQNSSTRGAHISSYFLQNKKSLRYFF